MLFVPKAFRRVKKESNYQLISSTSVGVVWASNKRERCSLTVNLSQLSRWPLRSFRRFSRAVLYGSGTTRLGPWDSDKKGNSFQYGYQTKTTIGLTEKYGSRGHRETRSRAVPAAAAPEYIVGVAAGLGIIGGGVVLVRKAIKGGKTPPQKTTVTSDGGNKTTPPPAPRARRPIKISPMQMTP